MSRFGRVELVIVLMAFMMLAAGCFGDDDDSTSSGQADDDAAPDDDNDAADDSPDDDAGDDDTWPPLPDNDDDTQDPTITQYPIVLAHGYMGWGYLGPLSNFYLVADTLTAQGYEVFEPWVDWIGTIEERAQELADAIDRRYPGQKVNIIAHSQGGLDARYMITHLGWGDRVASLTTLSTPHQGTSLADFALGLLPDSIENVFDWLLEALGMDFDGSYEMTREYVQNVFNPENPDDPRVAYYSFHGNGAELFAPLEITHAIIWHYEGCNDGIIGCVSATYGEDLGELPTDHFGIVGHPFGWIDFDYMSFYMDLAQFLADEGY